MKESDLVGKAIKKMKESRGGWWVKVHGGPAQESGIPDIIGCYKGYFVAIEMKLPGQVDVSPRQRLQLERIRRAQGVSVVLTTAEEALDLLDEIDSWGDKPARIRHKPKADESSVPAEDPTPPETDGM